MSNTSFIHPKRNSLKFQSGPKTEKSAQNEITDWISKNTNKFVSVHSTNDNIIEMSMKCENSNEIHLVAITFPKTYPISKKGFSCKEITIDNIVPLNFVYKANEQFDKKVLTIDRVLTHLSNTFSKYLENVFDK